MTPNMILKIERSDYLLETMEDAIELAKILNRAKPVDTRFLEIDGEYQHIIVESEKTGQDLFSLTARSELKAITESEYKKLRDLKQVKSENSDAA